MLKRWSAALLLVLSTQAQAQPAPTARLAEAAEAKDEPATDQAARAPLGKTHASSAEGDAPDIAYKAADAYQQEGDTRGLIKALGDFIDTYRDTKSQHERVVQAYLRIVFENRPRVGDA